MWHPAEMPEGGCEPGVWEESLDVEIKLGILSLWTLKLLLRGE